MLHNYLYDIAIFMSNIIVPHNKSLYTIIYTQKKNNTTSSDYFAKTHCSRVEVCKNSNIRTIIYEKNKKADKCQKRLKLTRLKLHFSRVWFKKKRVLQFCLTVPKFFWSTFYFCQKNVESIFFLRGKCKIWKFGAATDTKKNKKKLKINNFKVSKTTNSENNLCKTFRTRNTDSWKFKSTFTFQWNLILIFSSFF